MKNKNYIAFARGLVLFFAVSHALSYLVSTFQTLWIIREIKKAQQAKSGKKGQQKNDLN